MSTKRQTSEEVNGIMAQPRPTCPEIAKVIHAARSANAAFETFPRSGERSSVRTEARIDKLRDYTSEVEIRMENVRKNCEALRAWGDQWKFLAKRLLAERAEYERKAKEMLGV
jgi:hypothetical protein